MTEFDVAGKQQLVIEAYAILRNSELPASIRDRMLAALEQEHLDAIALLGEQGQMIVDYVEGINRHLDRIERIAQ